MSEGSGGAARAAPGLSEHQFNRYAGIALIAIGMLGPILALWFGKGVLSAFQDGMLNGAGEVLRKGGYSVPLLVFGLVALFVHIKNPQDFYGGAVMAAIALFGLWACSDLPGMRGFAFGPGTAPRLFAYGLLGLSVLISVMGLFTDGPQSGAYSFSGPIAGAAIIVALIPITYYSNRIGRSVTGVAPDIVVAALGAAVVIGLAFLLKAVAPRGPLFITAATLIFAITVRPLGLVFASFVSLMIVSIATEEGSWIETIIWSVVLTTFCALLFPWGLNLPLQLWPRL
jgi:putative tricarboxylic transport membrane protein